MTLCGSVCTGKKCGLMEAPLCFDTGRVGNQTLAKNNVSPQHSMTRGSGQMITAQTVSHSSVTEQVMRFISSHILQRHNFIVGFRQFTIYICKRILLNMWAYIWYDFYGLILFSEWERTLDPTLWPSWILLISITTTVSEFESLHLHYKMVYESV